MREDEQKRKALAGGSSSSNAKPKGKAVKAAKTTKATQKSVQQVASRSSSRTSNQSQSQGQQGQGKQSSGQSKLQHSLQTARVIASSKAHFNHAEVQALLHSYDKGWVDGPKFLQLLPPLLFN